MLLTRDVVVVAVHGLQMRLERFGDHAAQRLNSMLVDAGAESAMATGMRVKPRFSKSPKGGILDLECFVPEEGA